MPLALFSTAGIHKLVDASPWFGAASRLVAGATLAPGGGVPVSALKDRCLRPVPPPRALYLP